MAKKVFFFNSKSTTFVALFISICLISSASAGLILDSDDTVIISGNDPGSSTGSFVVMVDYGVYDGADASDPLGITADLQIVFQLTHLGGDGETPVLNFRRFTVFAPDVFSEDPFYTSINAVGAGKAPYDPYGLEDNQDGTFDGMALELPSGGFGANRAKFLFFDSLYGTMAGFAVTDVSQQLVLTVAPEDLPVSVIIEINGTDTSPGIHGDTSITLIPEPASIALFGVAFSILFRRRKQNT